jgi:hypothetical protein
VHAYAQLQRGVMRFNLASSRVTQTGARPCAASRRLVVDLSHGRRVAIRKVDSVGAAAQFAAQLRSPYNARCDSNLAALYGR